MKTTLLLLGLIALIAIEVLKVYFIIPFPHSQLGNRVGTSYFVNMHIWLLRLTGCGIIVYPLWQLLRSNRRWQKATAVFALLLYASALYLSNYHFAADRIFEEPKEKIFADAKEAGKHASQLVIGVMCNGQAKAYPVSVVSFHHQVKDTVGGKPVMVTYCSFCRDGRVYSPFIKGRYNNFRLVGMSNYNAIFEDESTKSWWRQSTGKAITGALKGMQLEVVPSDIMYLGQWLMAHPASLVMMPDKHFLKEYDEFNKGLLKLY